MNYIFDPVRKKQVRLTPEEWVRQHLLRYLIDYKYVPETLIGVEKQLTLNKLTKRFDLVVFNRKGAAVLLAECKAPSVAISQDVFDQAARYNMRLQARYFVITNGLQLFVCSLDTVKGVYSFLQDVPEFSTL